MEEKKFRGKEIPKKKKEAVEEIAGLINESGSLVIVSVKNLPSRQFQVIKKKLSKDATIKIFKKNITSRAIDKIERGTIKNLKSYLKEDQAIIFSQLDPFELSLILSKNKSMAKAKIGQEVEEDVIVEPGPTELIPGPVISELGSLGIQFAVEDGKISIQKRKVILKAGDKVTENASSIMGKLDMKPISVGLEPIVAYDAKEDKIYTQIKIDVDKTLIELKEKAGKALGLAVRLVYYCKETLGFLLGKAKAEEDKLSSLMKVQSQPEENKEKVEENKFSEEEK